MSIERIWKNAKAIGSNQDRLYSQLLQKKGLCVGGLHTKTQKDRQSPEVFSLVLGKQRSMWISTNTLEKSLAPILPFLVRQCTHPLFSLPHTLISSINLAYRQVKIVADSRSLPCEAWRQRRVAAMHLKNGRLLHSTLPQEARSN